MQGDWSTIIVPLVMWIMLGGIAHMIGGAKWSKKVWDAPFKAAGSILGWLLRSARDIIASAITGTWTGIRNAWRRRSGGAGGGGGRP